MVSFTVILIKLFYFVQNQIPEIINNSINTTLCSGDFTNDILFELFHLELIIHGRQIVTQTFQDILIME